MELFSLEEEGGGEMFITQSDSKMVPLVPQFDDNVGMDYEEGVRAQKQVLCPPIYSDISDDDAFEIPCSQVPNTTSRDR